MARRAWIVAVVMVVACADSGDEGPSDVGGDGGSQGDVTADAGPGDAGPGDAGPGDAGPGDAATEDAEDSSSTDAPDASGDEALCAATGGTWQGNCACGAGTAWKAGAGCESIEDCLLACGDGCFSAEQEVCGEDGAFDCPCDMACKGVAVAADPLSCCEPVPANCVPTCQDNTAMNCTTGQDAHGCLTLHWTTLACGDEVCVIDGESGGAGCVPDSLAACLLACGDGCFAPEQEVCGEDGTFGCPCELACHGVAVAADPLSCCEPVPPGCVATCTGGVATSCTTAPDAHGCPAQTFTSVSCGGMACLTATPSGTARCVDPCLPMDAALGVGECDTFWGWRWTGSGCESLAGTCTCVGADCYSLYESEGSCLAVHGVCLTTPDPEGLCEGTAGTYAEGACDCGEGGAFAPAYGCYPAWANACQGTGGLWQPAFCGTYCGDCQCEGEATFTPGAGCQEG